MAPGSVASSSALYDKITYDATKNHARGLAAKGFDMCISGRRGYRDNLLKKPAIGSGFGNLGITC